MKTDPDCPGAGAYKKLNDKDGFDGMMHQDKGRAGFSHIPQEDWQAIFGPKNAVLTVTDHHNQITMAVEGDENLKDMIDSANYLLEDIKKHTSNYKLGVKRA